MNALKRLSLLLLIIPWLLGSAHAQDMAKLVVVVNAASGVDALTREQVINIFLGRFRQLPTGMAALPVDQPAEQPLRADFYRQLVNKSPAEIRAYWARLVFSGKTAPPQGAKTQDEVLQWLAERPGAIGYLRADQLTPQLKVVFELGPAP